MKNYLKAHPIKFLVIVIIALLSLRVLVWGGLNMTGFCWAQKRWLSDEERIDKVIARIYGEPKTVWDSKQGRTKENPAIGYTDISDFKQKNPDCCHIGARDFGNGIWQPRSVLDEFLGFGRNRDIVSVSYQKQIVDAQGTMQSKLEQKWYGSTNCGKLWSN